MRLTAKEIEIITNVVCDIFGECRIILFGSRLDDSRKGGDIDLFVIAEEKRDLLAKKIKAVARLERKLGKPVDILIQRNFEREIEKEALGGIRIR